MTPRVLAIDTSTEGCSAALLWSDGEVRLRFEVIERGHADRVLPMIDDLLREADCRLEDLDGIAFGRGPGGFTGLRIAAGVTQGLAFGAGLPVAPVSSLAAVAFLAAVESEAAGVLVCNDARMNEVYWGAYRFDPDAPRTPVVLAPESVGAHDRVAAAPGVTCFAGNGVPAYPALQSRLEAGGLRYVPALYPRADAIACLGAAMLQRGECVGAAAAVPVYVRDDVARPSVPGVT